MLPTVFATGWMAQACSDVYQQAGYQFSALEEYRLFKGVVFNKDVSKVRLLMGIEELSVSDTQLLLKVSIWSEQKGKRINHYGANVILRQALLQGPAYQYFDRAERSTMTGSELYDNGTLFHGPIFQGVQKVINVSEEKLTLRCGFVNSDVQPTQFKPMVTNPYFDDLMYQAMLVWAREQYGAASLPSGFHRLEQYELLPLDAEVFLSLDVKKHRNSELEADVFLHDARGKIYSRMLSGKVTISKSLNDSFVSHQ